MSRASGRSSSASTTRPSGLERGSAPSRSSGSGPVAVPNPSDPPPVLALHGRDGRQVAQREQLGRAEHVPNTCRCAGRSSVAGRRTGRSRLPARRPRGYAVEIAARVAFLDSNEAAKPPSASSSPCSVVPAAGTSSTSAERRGRQRAGLVDAKRVDGCERLDRVQLLRQGARARHAERCRRVRHREEQDQALRDERHHSGDRRVDGMAHPDVLLHERHDQHRAEGDHHARGARRGACRSSARAASVGGGTRGPSPRSAPRSSPLPPPRPRTCPLPRRRTSPTGPPRPATGSTACASPVRIDSSSRRPSRPAAARLRRPGRRARAGSDPPRRSPRRAPTRGSPSLTTVACGATSAASSSSFRLARSSCQIPMPVFVTTIARKSASRQSPKTSVRRPSESRIALNGVRVLARTIVRVDRLAAASGGSPARRQACRRLRLGQARAHRERLRRRRHERGVPQV